MKKKGGIELSLVQIFGLVILASILIIMLPKIFGVQNWLIQTIKNMVAKPNVFNLASEHNFNRLNKDISSFIDSKKQKDSISIPYTLGKKYSLIGFNENDITNECFKKYSKPYICKNDACLCLCENNKEKTCINCKKYDIRRRKVYFIGGEDKINNCFEGDAMNKIDPVTRDTAYCMQIDGGKWIDINWKTSNLYIEKITDNENYEVFIYIGREDDSKNRISG
ncbi:MAG: hypothetical protein MAG795_01008 [Candidatus Woesearchaeota archaeon]|nr:hypothetical protein [Candidatus Woesearchaeota archaeon]